MFFGLLGDLAAKRAPIVVGLWVAALIACVASAPKWSSVVQNGEFAFLPPDSPSRVAEEGFSEAFPEDMLASSVVIIVRRESGDQGLEDADRRFISERLVPALHRIVGLPMKGEEIGPAPREQSDGTKENPEAASAEFAARFAPLVHQIQWFEDRKVGDLLDSEDGQASLVVIKLTTEFLDQAIGPLVDAVEDYVQQLYRTPIGQGADSIPAGLDIAVSGSATFGRDMIRESGKSSQATEKWTVILVVVLLIIIYRAPLLAFIPLMTVAVSTAVALSLLALAADHGWLNLFNGIETYVTVVVYGSGVDYCLFLMARYREELDEGLTIEEALARTLRRVGPALATSAGTAIFGIGMMVFAEFGKFRQASIAITFGLAICLLAALTLTPAVLRLFGRWAFWPNVATQSPRTESGFLTQTSWLSRLQRANLMQQSWHRVALLVERRPGLMWLLSVVGMFPFSVIGVLFFGFLSYGLLSELPDDSTSVKGTSAIQSHFPAGEVGPVYVKIVADGVDFRKLSREPERLMEQVTAKLVENADRLGLHSIRSLSSPKGQRGQVAQNAGANVGQRKLARDYYVSKEDSSVTRLDLIFRNDPFSRTSIDEFRRLRDELPGMLPEELKGAKISFIGPTPNISDLKDVTDRDQIRIDLMVLVSVYLVLVTLLRRPGICAYLILSVFYSYLATLGVTFVIFWGMDPAGFSGLDWKVPLFLFTILIAIGEDYNIFLMTRVDEEQKIHGPIRGITVALDKTGSIISSCGIIMAGSFISLTAGSLMAMDQLGLALALGVLLDTFIVRPIMVPAYLVLLTSGRLGIVSRMSGYPKQLP